MAELQLDRDFDRVAESDPERVRFTVPANRDLLDILSFAVHRDPRAAARLLESIERTTRRLARFPEQGHRRRDLTEDPHVRFAGLGNFMIVYRIKSPPLEVLRILHGSQDIPALLRMSS